MEELIQNFMLVTEGPQMPKGEVYFEAENPKGALGFYVVSKGGGVPYRLKIRGPSFCNLSILSELLPGHFLTDITVILGSLDFVMGNATDNFLTHMDLKQSTLDKIDKLVPRYPDKRSAALPLCHLVQEDLGYLSNESIEWIAERLDLEPINISEIVTFYPMLKPKLRVNTKFECVALYLVL